MWLLYASCAWVGGILLGSRIGFSFLLLSFALVPFALLPLLPARRTALLTAGICLLALFGGILRLPSELPSPGEDTLAFYNDSGIVEIQGMVTEPPDVRDRFCLLTIAAEGVSVEGEYGQVSGKVLVRLPRYPVYRYGDILRMTGKLETPPELEDFDYAGYLADRGIHSIMYYPGVEILDRGQGAKLLQWMHSVRQSLSDSLARALPEPQASLAQGILLGMRDNVPESLNQSFSRTGTAHLLAISGLHVGIIVAMLLSFGIMVFGRQRYIYIWVALVIVWLYVLLIGMRPPIVRAAIMGSLFLLAEYLGRQRSAIIALAFAAAVMAGFQPHLLWSVSFQLSFAAMSGLVLLLPPLQTLGRRGVTRLFSDRPALVATGTAITEVFSASLAAVAVVWPIIAYNFGIVSLVGLPATFLALPALPFIIVTSGLVGFAGLFSLLGAQVLGWLAWLFLTYLVAVVRGFDSLPYSSLEVGHIHGWHVWGYYAILAGVVACVNYRQRLAEVFSRMTSQMRNGAQCPPRAGPGFSPKWLVLPLLIAAVLVWAVALTQPGDNLHVSFLDVGQGDAILIRTPDGHNILIDGGPDPRKLSLALGEKLPFWDRTIDLVVCTQPQADHITGLLEVVQRYNVKQILDSGVPYDSSVYREWLRLIEEKDIEFNVARSGQEIDLGRGIVLQVLNPPQEFFEGTSCDVDNNGIVLKLTWNKVSFLLTADIRQEAELYLIMERANLRSTVLKVAHHGSMTSTLPQFLAAADPEVAVISVGAENPFGHPSPEVIQRLVDRVGIDSVYRTDRHGTVDLITDGERLWVKTDK
ncbi:MAG: ComEC/Rec2 family competence protein [Dehalococcoidia bacterium]